LEVAKAEVVEQPRDSADELKNSGSKVESVGEQYSEPEVQGEL